jgi:hypothetical protein
MLEEMSAEAYLRLRAARQPENKKTREKPADFSLVLKRTTYHAALICFG